MNITLTPRKVYFGFLALIGALLLANLVGIGLTHFTEHDYAWGLISLFEFNAERNVPALYSSLAILLAALLMLGIARRQARQGEPVSAWYGLAIVFAFLSFDEMASVHEKLAQLGREQFEADGIYFRAWVVPYGVAVLVLAGIYAPFLFRLPRRTTLLFVVSGIIFVSGAIGMEIVGGLHFQDHGPDLTYALFATVEETLEKVGIATFIFGLLDYMALQFGQFSFQVAHEE